MPTDAPNDVPTDIRTERHLAMLDDLAEIGMVLVRRMQDEPGRDTYRHFDTVSRAIRRTILLSHMIMSGHFALKANAPLVAEPDPAEPGLSTREPSDIIRLDARERLDDVSGPFEDTVAAIVRDLQRVTGRLPRPASGPAPELTPELAPELVLATSAKPSAPLRRPEADTPDLN